MKTVKIVSGVYGADNGKGGVTAIARGQTCEVSDAEAARLVSLGVAAMAVATLQEGQTAPEAGENTPEGDNAQEGAVGHLDAGQLSSMTNAQLKQLAEDMGLDVTKCKKKADFIELITAEEVIVPTDGEEGEEEDDTVDDGELPPDLEAEAPVE